jgi:hypothetical protein
MTKPLKSPLISETFLNSGNKLLLREFRLTFKGIYLNC